MNWLSCLEKYSLEPDSNPDFWSHREVDDDNAVQIECMRSFGTLEDILGMIEEGDQGKPLRSRVHAIRNDSNCMRKLRQLWEDRELIKLMYNYL
jgi:hypothetical protein